jgi:transcriptional regulator with XRE-family HTH domain
LLQSFVRNCEKVKIIHYLCSIKLRYMEDVNRIKLVLVEKKRTNKWLSEQMGVTPSTVSKWCTNSSQPDLPSLLKIADLLEVDIKELIVREYKSYLLSQESK